MDWKTTVKTKPVFWLLVLGIIAALIFSFHFIREAYHAGLRTH
jgi:hypothetical protein